MDSAVDDAAVLIGLDGKYEGRRWVMSEAEFVIGRSPDCHLVVADRQVSRHHAHLLRGDVGHVLEDLGSKNGTHLNGVRIAERVRLKDGDEIQIALAVKLAYLGSEATVQLGHPSREGRLWLDALGHRVLVLNEELFPPLSAAQYKLLELLYRNSNRVVSREEIIANVWVDTEAQGVSEQAIDALIRRLRDRLYEVDSDHNYVVTVRGHGFRFDNP